jgi:hypothetical protein
LDPQGSTLVMGYQVGLHQLLDVLILGLLQGFNNNDSQLSKVATRAWVEVRSTWSLRLSFSASSARPII